MTLSTHAIKRNRRGRSTADGNVLYVAALLMEYFFHKLPWWIVGLYTPPPHSIQMAPVIGEVTHDPVNARH